MLHASPSRGSPVGKGARTMTRPLQFGVSVLQQEPWPTMLERWQRAEEFGFDSAWMPDHLVHPRQPEGEWHEAWTLLAALAARTQRIQIGTMVTNILLRNPLLLLKGVVTVDHISNGRVELALGSGNAHSSYAAAGIDPGEIDERERSFAQAV